MSTNKALDVKDQETGDHNVLIVGESRDRKSPDPSPQERSQIWRIDRDGNGYFKIVSRWNGKPIDIPYGSRDPGTPLSQCDDNNQLNQRWKLMRIK